MPTLVLSHRFSPDSNALWRAAVGAGWDVERIHGFAVPDGLSSREPVLYGETLFADAVRHELGIALLQPTDDWLPGLPESYRLRDVALMTVAEATRLAVPRFLKPVDEKWFRAGVYASGGDIPLGASPGGDAAVLVAEPVTFGLECRAFIVDRTIAALSPYMRNGDLATDGEGNWSASEAELEQARELLGVLLADERVALPPAVVIDVGDVQGRGWAVVEANAAWASGLCDCSPEAVLSVLRRATLRRNEGSRDDARWWRV